MKLVDFRTHFNQSLADKYPKTEIDAFFFRLIKSKLGFEIMDLFTKQNTTLSKEEETAFNEVLKRLLNEEPIQYILGETEFYGLPFKVNQHTLIPRPETEELVSWVIKEASQKTASLKILDVGTGTGCIAISLKQELKNAEITAIDVSEKALEMAKLNTDLNNVTINFIQADILKTSKLPQQFNVIVSNPPYVRELEKKQLKNNVLNHEPHLALFVTDDDPLIFYEKIADFAKQNLEKNGLLFFEINQYLGKETVALMNEKGFSFVELKKDLFGNDRMLKAIL